MAAQDLFRNKVDETPTIYAYTLPDVPKYKGLLKVGYISRHGTIGIQEQGHELYPQKLSITCDVQKNLNVSMR